MESGVKESFGRLHVLVVKAATLPPVSLSEEKTQLPSVMRIDMRLKTQS
jgi:hypothetical protein